MSCHWLGIWLVLAAGMGLLAIELSQFAGCTLGAAGEGCGHGVWFGHDRRSGGGASSTVHDQPVQPASNRLVVEEGSTAAAVGTEAVQSVPADFPTTRVAISALGEPSSWAEPPDPFDPESPPFLPAETMEFRRDIFGKRPWKPDSLPEGAGGESNFTLSPETDALRTFKPQQLFTPNVALDPHLHKDAAAGCLVGRADPFVLSVEPRHLRAPRRNKMEAYNPSIARLPIGGGYLISYRVDYQSGCVVQKKGIRAQFRARKGFRHTCVVRADSNLRPIGPARVLDPCGRIMTTDSRSDHDGATQVIDARLARLGPRGRERVWLTYLAAYTRLDGVSPACSRCCRACEKNTHLARVFFRNGWTEEAGPRAQQRAAGVANPAEEWAVSLRGQVPLCAPAIAGRNHALFQGTDGRPKVQAWLHPKLVYADVPPPYLEPMHGRRRPPKPAPIVPASAPSVLRFRTAEGGKCRHLRISGTSPFVAARARGREILLAVGHLHHCPVPNRTHFVTARSMSMIHNGIAYFGSHYMHFFYALDAEPPHALLAHSAEWCLPSAAGSAQCEVVQFVSGLEIAHGERDLLLTYGANDCEARWTSMPLDAALALLEWPAEESGV